ncbi:MAG: hypothetical protein ACOX5Z_00195 [Desulfobulbus sp.]|jgi:hypothetical protein
MTTELLDLLDVLLARVGELSADLRLHHLPTGSLRAPRIINGFLPAARPADRQEGDEYPLVRVSLHRFAYSVAPTDVEVLLIGGIHTPGTVADGNRDILTLAECLGGMTRFRCLGEYRLIGPIQCALGSQERGEEGIQPHPYHFCMLRLVLERP